MCDHVVIYNLCEHLDLWSDKLSWALRLSIIVPCSIRPYVC